MAAEIASPPPPASFPFCYRCNPFQVPTPRVISVFRVSNPVFVAFIQQVHSSPQQPGLIILTWLG
jgi:hypothetical protein